MERQSQKPQLRWRRKEGMRLGGNNIFLKILRVFQRNPNLGFGHRRQWDDLTVNEQRLRFQ